MSYALKFKINVSEFEIPCVDGTWSQVSDCSFDLANWVSVNQNKTSNLNFPFFKFNSFSICVVHKWRHTHVENGQLILWQLYIKVWQRSFFRWWFVWRHLWTTTLIKFTNIFLCGDKNCFLFWEVFRMCLLSGCLVYIDISDIYSFSISFLF